MLGADGMTHVPGLAPVFCQMASAASNSGFLHHVYLRCQLDMV